MQHRSQQASRGPADVRRARVLIEDSRVDLTTIDLEAARSIGMDVTICSGPSRVDESCLLVTRGRCPLGRPDAVVCALDGPWRASVEAAWRADGIPIAGVDANAPVAWPAHLGLALTLAATVNAEE